AGRGHPAVDRFHQAAQTADVGFQLVHPPAGLSRLRRAARQRSDRSRRPDGVAQNRGGRLAGENLLRCAPRAFRRALQLRADHVQQAHARLWGLGLYRAAWLADRHSSSGAHARPGVAIAIAVERRTRSVSAMARRVPSLSVVIPVYNSAALLPELLARLEPVLQGCAAEFEAVFVNDASRDDNWRVLARVPR